MKSLSNGLSNGKNVSVKLMHRNWFMFSPHNNWMASIVSLVNWHAEHGRNYDEIMKVIFNYAPLSGWDDETKQFVKLAAKIATSEDDEQL